VKKKLTIGEGTSAGEKSKRKTAWGRAYLLRGRPEVVSQKGRGGINLTGFP